MSRKRTKKTSARAASSDDGLIVKLCDALDQVEADVTAVDWARVPSKTLAAWALEAEAIEQQVVDAGRLAAFMQRLIDRARAEGQPDSLALVRAKLYLLLLGDTAKAEIKRRREKHVGVAFVNWLEQEGIPDAIVEAARDLVRRSVGAHLPDGARADIMSRESTGATHGPQVVNRVIEAEAVIQTARRLKRKRGIHALLDAHDGKHDLLGKRTANRIADAELRHYERRVDETGKKTYGERQVILPPDDEALTSEHASERRRPVLERLVDRERIDQFLREHPKLPPQALADYAAGHTLKRIAAEHDIDPRTLRRWLRARSGPRKRHA